MLQISQVDGPLEILSLVGTLSGGHGHLHISLSDSEGRVVGGHLIGDDEIFTTVEVSFLRSCVYYTIMSLYTSLP